MGEIAGVASGTAVVDLGCGEGFFGRTLFAGRDVSYCGIDLSVHALRAAARSWPEATWVVANADRRLPLLDASVDLVLSLFGRRPAEDVARVLRPGAAIVVAVPAADDLAELRAASLGHAASRERVPGVVDALGPHLTIAERHEWRERKQLDRSAIEDALALTYRGARHSQRARIAELREVEVTLSAEILKAVKSDSRSGDAELT